MYILFLLLYEHSPNTKINARRNMKIYADNFGKYLHLARLYVQLLYIFDCCT